MKKNKIYVLISILTVIILLSTSALCNFCGTRGTEPSVENITGELASGEIISSEDVEVYLPPDFQEDQPTIYISEVTRGLPSPPLGSDSVGNAYEITSESELAGPVMITLDYDPGDLPSGASEDNLYIATLSGENWEIVPDGFIDTERHTVSATVGHFSNFWVMAFEKGKESIDDLYNKATSTFYKETPRFYSDLPREIRDDLEYNLVKPEEVKAVTEFHIQYFAKLAYGHRPYLDALSKTASLAWQYGMVPKRQSLKLQPRLSWVKSQAVPDPRQELPFCFSMTQLTWPVRSARWHWMSQPAPLP